jgi:hypothetical protein
MTTPTATLAAFTAAAASPLPPRRREARVVDGHSAVA